MFLDHRSTRQLLLAYSPTAQSTFEHRCRRFDGVYRWFQVRALAVRDTGGNVRGWYVLLTDIDDRKRAVAELRRSQANLVEAQRLSKTGSISWLMDTDDPIVVSDEFRRIFELNDQAPVTLQRMSESVHPDDLSLFAEKLEEARSGRNLDYVIRLPMQDASIKYVRTFARVVRNQFGQSELLGSIQDITESRIAEAALTRAREELANVTRITSLAALTASIAHEVNQPLSGIVTNASTCMRMLSSDPPNLDGARETARRTIRDGNRASDVVSRLRALFAKKEVLLSRWI